MRYKVKIKGELLDNKGFDTWSGKYDEDILKMQNEGYPFEGYYNTLGFIQDQVIQGKGKKVLDIGIGTGLLTEELYKTGIEIVGVDFSEKMLEKAKEKMPNARFIKFDFNLSLPEELKQEKFDFIISSYAIHHIDNTKKIKLFKDLIENLSKDGMILIGDVAFETIEELENIRERFIANWDDGEYYIVADDILKVLNTENIKSEFVKTSRCSGVLMIKKE